jgi:hypothetical protein
MHTEKKPDSTSSPLSDLEPPILSEKRQADNEEIRQLAYYFWQQRGSPTDSSEEDWYRAEQEVAASNGKSRAAHHV